MTETLMAFLAMMLMMFFALSQNRAIVENELVVASTELEVLASGVASEMMQSIASKPFDANTNTDMPEQDLADLTSPDDFGSGLDCTDSCEDIDDFNAMAPYAIELTLGTDAYGNPLSFTFEVTAEVVYVDENGNESSTPTWTKEVTLYVDQAVDDGKEKYMRHPVVKKRRFSPQWGV